MKMLDVSKPMIYIKTGEEVRYIGPTSKGALCVDNANTVNVLIVDGYGLDIITKQPLVRNVPEKHKGWINIYPSECAYVGVLLAMYNTREGADAGAMPQRIACIQVEYTEGEGL
jgi:hypothetical protein